MKTDKHHLTSETSPEGTIEVWQTGTTRNLYINSSTATQSQLDIADKATLQLQYTRAMMSFLLLQPNPKSALLLGLGGGSIIHFLSHYLPSLNITAVDSNAHVINLAQDYFDIRTTDHINLRHADALTYLAQTSPEQYDTLLVDIHDGLTLPEFLFQDRFMALCFHTLTKNGVLVINLLITEENQFLTLMKALRIHFKDISLCITLENEKNIIVLAFKTLPSLDIEVLKNTATQCQEKYAIEFNQFVKNIIIIPAQNEIPTND